jgi:Tfp pilus assembly protein PilW
MNAINKQLSDIYGTCSRRVRSAWASFDSDEAGLSTIEMLLLLFIGVVIIIAIIAYFWSYIWPTIQNIINDLFAQNTN